MSHCRLENGRRLLEGLFIHIKAAVHLDLQRVEALVGLAIMLGYVAPCIGLVQGDAIAEALQQRLDEAGDFRSAGSAEAIPEHKIGPAAPIRLL